MNNVLVIKNSINGEQGQSNQLVNHFSANYPNANITTRDLSASDLGHLNMDEMGAWMTPAQERSAEQNQLAQLSDELIAELSTADTVVIGMPMYNFGIPSYFKAWIDRVARAGVTFKYTEQGPVGLLGGKKVVIIATRGGFYQGTEADSQTQYLKDVLGFIGLSEVEFIYAEGLAIDGKEERIESAQAEVLELLKRDFI